MEMTRMLHGRREVAWMAAAGMLLANLFTNSAIAFNATSGKINWWHQYTPNDSKDYDETGSQFLIDGRINGEERKLVAHPGRNGFTYSFDRLNGQFLKATQHVTGELKKRAEFPYPNSSGTLSTAGGLVFTGMLDGTIVALDDQTLDELWRFNVGTGFNAAPMTYAVNGKQYVAIASGVCCVRPSGQISNSLGAVRRTPALRDQSNATVLYVFGM
jgi:glucose dehydrogenase